MLDSVESACAAPSRSMARKPAREATKPPKHETIPGQADRLKRIRAAFEFETGSAFAAFLGISIGRYNPFENGSPLSREVAFLIVQRVPGISLDWLYFGKSDGMSIEMLRRLGLLSAPPKR